MRAIAGEIEAVRHHERRGADAKAVCEMIIIYRRLADRKRLHEEKLSASGTRCVDQEKLPG